MLKNFKKIIATVAALAIASSSFVAMAATYPDVTPDASYYSAVEQLSALGMISGFDDGTFKADEKVTRAQMAKLVVGAKNLLAAAESNTTQKFNDVPATHWAVGYVAEGVAQGIINGTSETTFDPEATVTFAQATKMLVNACGYEEYAQIAGGWPNGYLSWGSKIGVNKGVTGVGNDTELTRGQVAQMICNAVKAPILKIVEYYMDEGVRVPEYAQMDGDRNRFESLLTEYWNVYEVYGRVTETSRSGAKKVGKIDYLVEKTDNYSDNEAGNPIYANNVFTGSYSTIGLTDVASEGKGAEDLFLEYTYALVALDADDQATLVYIEEAGKNKYVEITDDLYVDSSFDGTKLDLYKSETSSSTKAYAVDPTIGLIVNGVFVPYDANWADTDGDGTADAFTAYNTATVEAYLSGSFENGYLIDSPTGWNPSTDSKYDYIVMDTYATAVLEEVVTKNDGKSKVIFSATTNGVNSIMVDPEDEDKEYSFVLTDGTALEVTDLKKNDVLSIKADPTNYAGSDFYEVIVSRDTAEGKVTGTGTHVTGATLYTVGDGEYKAVTGLSPAFGMLKTYTLFLDKNGDVAKTELVASSVNYAIVDRFFNNAGDNKVRLILKDGSKVDYAVKADNTLVTADVDGDTVLESLSAEMGFAGTQYDLVSGGSNTVVSIVDRVVEYTVNSSNEATLTSTSFVVAPGSAQFNERTSRIGSYGISDTSIILNAAEFAINPSKSVVVIEKANLLNEMAYTAAFIGERNTSDGTYPMVVLLTDTSGYTTSSELMVAAGSVISITDDGETLQAIPVYAADGTKTQIVLDSACTYVGATSTIVEGTPFVAKTTSSGKATQIWTLLDPAADFKHVTTLGSTDFTMLGKTTVGTAATAKLAEPGAGITFNGETAADQVRFVVAPVVKKYDGGVALATDLGTPAANQSADAGVFFAYAADAKAYCYDASVRNGAKVSVAESLALVAQSVITNSGMVAPGSTIVDWTSADNTPAFAVARIYDNDIQEIYSIVLN